MNELKQLGEIPLARSLTRSMDCKLFFVNSADQACAGLWPDHMVNNGGFRGWEYSTAEKEDIEDLKSDELIFRVWSPLILKAQALEN